MKKFLTIFAIAFFSMTLVTATSMAGHKDSHTGGGGGGGGGGTGAPPETNVVNGSDCTNSTIVVVGAFNFGYETPSTATTIRAGLASDGTAYVDCIGFYNVGGNHDVLMGDHDTGSTLAFCDFSGKKVCYINMSAVANATEHWVENGNGVYHRSLHCHQHEGQDMIGAMGINVIY